MSIFSEIIRVERNGTVFLLHWRYRYDPATLAVGALVAGTSLQVFGTLQQGDEAERIAKERAAIDIRNAEAVREAAVEEADIKGEQRRRFLATQKSQAAAGGIRINVGSPLVIEAETQAAFAKDIGFGLERGRVESEAFRSSARLEKKAGKAAKKQSRFRALSQGLLGFGSIASLGGASTTTRSTDLTKISSPFALTRNFP